jgi:hypothetical protein
MTDTYVAESDRAGSANRQKSSRARRSRTLLIIIIVILLLSMCVIGAVIARLALPSSKDVATGQDAGGIEWVRSIYGFGTAQDQLFVRPAKVDVTENGNILVVDQEHRFVMEYSPEGDLVRTIGEGAHPELYAVGAIEDGAGELFFGQTPQGYVRVFSNNGEEEASFPFPSPNDIEYDATNDRLAISTNVGFVIFGSDGQPLYEIGGTQGDGPNDFDVIPGIAYGPDGTLYVLDAYNNRMSAYDTEGNRVWQVQTGKPAKGLDITQPAMAASDESSGTARLQVPSDVVVDSNNRLVVVDAMDFSITVFSATDGSLIAKYGQYGTKDGQFMYPSSIDYDPERDWFVVADGGNRRVQIVRIPDSSSGGGGVIAAARRAISGPLRALLAPLLLLLIAWLILRRRRGQAVGDDAYAAQDTLDSDETTAENVM